MTTSAEDRERQVRAAINVWRGQLIDLSWRNQLLFYRDLRFGTLDFADADPAAVARLLTRESVPLSSLFRRTLLSDRLKRVRAIRNKAREALEERGIGICSVAVGQATWRNTAGAATPAAPVLLLEATITPTTAAEDDFELAITGDPTLNPALAHLLSEQFAVQLDPDAVVAGLDSAPGREGGVAWDPQPAFDRLTAAAERVPGFAIKQRTVLGTFSYTKLPLVQDLSANVNTLIKHDIVAAIAGNSAAAATIAAAGEPVAVTAPDEVAPNAEYLVLDADSSQSYAVNAAIAGQSLVISGPPGTGKSQTIANLIASLVAHGKSVLFVAEKRAAISAVLGRLHSVGLGDAVFDAHDGGGPRAQLIERLTSGLRGPVRAVGTDGESATARHAWTSARQSLATHAAAMNVVREPWQVSVFAAQSALLGLRARHGVAAATQVRLHAGDIDALDAGAMRRVREEIVEFATLGGLSLTIAESVWSAARIDTASDAEAALALAGRLASETLPQAWRALDDLAAATGVLGGRTLAEWRTILAVLDDAARVRQQFGPQAFTLPLDEMATATAPLLTRSRASFDGEQTRRQLRAAAVTHWVGNVKPARAQLHEALADAAAVRARWAALAPAGTPDAEPELSAANARIGRAIDDLHELSGLLGWLDFTGIPRAHLNQMIAGMARDEPVLRRLPRINQLAAGLRERGLEPLLGWLRERGADPESAAAAFETCWYSSVLDRVSFTDPALANFDARLLDEAATRFRALDTAHIRGAADRVLDNLAERFAATTAQFPEQSRILNAEAARQKGHLSLRQLFAATPDLMTAVKPCWAMSPLVVSHLVPGDREYFDVVVFDEASQIVPADSIAAISRARQVIVAGDRKQLPPTQFFAADAEDTGEHVINPDGSINLALTSGYESILDVLSAALGPARTRSLTWHYRSHDERLIAFANNWVYDGSLTTFPGVAGSGCLRLEVVRRARASDADDNVAAEVDRVVTRILEHAEQQPHRSLGVITMGISHMERIDRRLRERLKARPRLRGFFDEPPGEPFFVKNLERVQGDERDSIILSIGYGKRADGSLSHNFGPLNQEGGHRRLNVAITRARSEMIVVSSFAHTDMDPERCTAPGVAMLRAWLQYAAQPATVSSADTADGGATETDSAFARSVRDRLTAAGLPVEVGYGISGQRIDFALARPDGRAMAVAIETDGPGYFSGATIRDRDRLRTEQLQRLGWGHLRLWSREWFLHPEAATVRLHAGYLRAVAGRDNKPVVPGRAIGDYRDGELVALLDWMAETPWTSPTPGRARGEADEQFRRFRAELGFAKSTARVRAAFDRAREYTGTGTTSPN